MQTFNDAIWEYRRKVLDKHRFWLNVIDEYRWLLYIPFIRHKNIRPFLADCEEYCWIAEPIDVLFGNGIEFDIAQCKHIKSLNYLIKHYEGLRKELLKKFPHYKLSEHFEKQFNEGRKFSAIDNAK